MTIRLSFFFILLTTVAIAHALAIEFYLYWKYDWFDLPMHFFGGMTVAFGVLILPFFRINYFNNGRALLKCMSAVMIVGVLWEIFEVTTGIARVDAEYPLDTIIDLVLDGVGGFIGYYVMGRMNMF